MPISKDFSELVKAVSNLAEPARHLPVPENFIITSSPTSSETGTVAKSARIYFLSSKPQGLSTRLVFYVDVCTDSFKEGLDNYWRPAQGALRVALPSSPTTSPTNPGLASELIRERMRTFATGILSFSMQTISNSSTWGAGEKRPLIINEGSSRLVYCPDVNSGPGPYEFTEVQTAAACLMPALCPCAGFLVCFTDSQNLWLVNTGDARSVQLTHSIGQNFTNGHPTYVMQEEFHRYEGFWWAPKAEQVNDKEQILHILFESNDESAVMRLRLPNFKGEQRLANEEESEDFDCRFPRPGQPNAVSNLEIVAFTLSKSTNQNEENHHFHSPRRLRLGGSGLMLKDLVKDMEYLVRCGWTKCAKFVWFQSLNRNQNKLEVYLVPLSSFQDSSCTDSHTKSIRLILLMTVQCASDQWIKIDELFDIRLNDCEEDSDWLCAQIIYHQSNTGFKHIYVSRSKFPKQNVLNVDSKIEAAVHIENYPVTSGNFEVTSTELFMDSNNCLIFFTASTDLESNVFVASYNRKSSQPVHQLTGLRSFDRSPEDLQLCAEDSPLCYQIEAFDAERNILVVSASNLYQSSQILLLQVTNVSSTSTKLAEIHLALIGRLVEPVSSRRLFPGLISQPQIQRVRVPITWSEPTEQTEVDMFGLLFSPAPAFFQQDRRAPLIHKVYGGPHVQLAPGSFPLMHYRFASVFCARGFAVLVCDVPGSMNRGMFYEQAIKYRMGQIEGRYHREFVERVLESEPRLDPSRVGVTGWSYGGYLSLLCLMASPDVYKVSVAGGLVSQWELYDSGYTERYLGVPEDHPEAYEQGNLVSRVADLPSEPHRLLVIHGGHDENVHLFHLTRLITAMVQHNKPYDFLFYPLSRHGVVHKHHLTASILQYFEEHL